MNEIWSTFYQRIYQKVFSLSPPAADVTRIEHTLSRNGIAKKRSLMNGKRNRTLRSLKRVTLRAPTVSTLSTIPPFRSYDEATGWSHPPCDRPVASSYVVPVVRHVTLHYARSRTVHTTLQEARARDSDVHRCALSP